MRVLYISILFTLFSQMALSQNSNYLVKDSTWHNINVTPFMFSVSPFSSYSDCTGMPSSPGLPASFKEHIVTDSLQLSHDLKWVKITFRYFGMLNQVDTNDLFNYALLNVKDTTYKNSYPPHKKYKKVGDAMYCFNYYDHGIFNKESKSDSLLLLKALKVKKENCYDNFPFSDCPSPLSNQQIVQEVVGASWKTKTITLPDCYNVTELFKINNDAQPITITFPLEPFFVGCGAANLELHNYLWSWNNEIGCFLKPITGNYKASSKTWTFNYDKTKDYTTAKMSIYNGGIDTLFIERCLVSAGNAMMMKYPKKLAPGTWGLLELGVNHANLSQTSIITITTERKTDNKIKPFYLNFKIPK